MTGFCNFISTPLVISPNYYLIKSCLESLADEKFQEQLENVSTEQSISTLLCDELRFCARRAMLRYQHEGWGYLKVAWSCWIPINLLCFAVVPVHWRVPFTSFSSVFAQTAQSMNQTTQEGIRAVDLARDGTVVMMSKDDSQADSAGTVSDSQKSFVGERIRPASNLTANELARMHNVELSRDVTKALAFLTSSGRYSSATHDDQESRAAARSTDIGKRPDKVERSPPRTLSPRRSRMVSKEHQILDANTQSIISAATLTRQRGNEFLGEVPLATKNYSQDPDIKGYGDPEQYAKWRKFNHDRVQSKERDGGTTADQSSIPNGGTDSLMKEDPTIRQQKGSSRAGLSDGMFGVRESSLEAVVNESKDADIRGYGDPSTYAQWRRFNYDRIQKEKESE